MHIHAPGDSSNCCAATNTRKLNSFGLSIFVRVDGPDAPEREVKSEVECSSAETCLDSRSMATTPPVFVVGISSTRRPVSLGGRCSAQSHDRFTMVVARKQYVSGHWSLFET